MKAEDPKRPRNWTTARLESLTGSQVKALLVVASASRAHSAEPPKKDAAEDERLLAEMSRAHGDSTAGLLDKVSNEVTSVEELIRIKNLAKVLMKESGDSRHLEAARLLYHVAVAAAFVYHAASISGRPIRKQQLLYDRLAETWTGHAIGRLFGRAAASAGARVSTGSQAPEER
jgi:hypothetical protein